MIKIAFLGSDSTHTEAFAKRINLPGGPFHNQAQVISIWGENEEQTRKKAADLRIEKIAKDPADALKDADLAMVIGRFGDSHFKPAEAALKAGIPTFVDKPFTLSFAEAQALADLSRKTGTPLFSASPLRFCNEVNEIKQKLLNDSANPVSAITVSGPAHCIDLQGDARFESTFFYGIHAVEVLLEILGSDAKELQFNKGKNTISARMEFGSRTGTLQLVREINEFYQITVFQKEGPRTFDIQLDGSHYENELSFILDDFYRQKKGTPLESSLNAISILEKIGSK